MTNGNDQIFKSLAVTRTRAERLQELKRVTEVLRRLRSPSQSLIDATRPTVETERAQRVGECLGLRTRPVHIMIGRNSPAPARSVDQALAREFGVGRHE